MVFEEAVHDKKHYCSYGKDYRHQDLDPYGSHSAAITQKEEEKVEKSFSKRVVKEGEPGARFLDVELHKDEHHREKRKKGADHKSRDGDRYHKDEFKDG